MKSMTVAFLALLFSGGAPAAGPEVPLQRASIDLGNTASLQRGAAIFVNNCMGCHSAQYMRYSRLAEDLELTEEQVNEFLIFDDDKKIGDVMTIAMEKEAAQGWFGAAPPDLSLVARSRGPDWVYTFLKSFHADASRPTGWNNTVFQNTAMPHVLWQQQGIQVVSHADDEAAEGDHGGHAAGPSFDVVQAGTMSAEEYDRLVTDLVNFLEYVGEPAKLKRESLGIWVMLYLVVFTFLAWLLKKEFWRDVH
ncbi:MAG: cytochrome c1 [Xanthomonadales bacterium]|nr:cytochrome c1 [Xanthomonadales bacterium]